MTAIHLKEKNFIQVGGNYGFNQHHIQGKSASYLRNRSCGLSALLNVLFYEEGKYLVTRAEEERLLRDSVKILRPKPWGIITFSEMNRALHLAKVPYGIVPYGGKFTRDEVLAYLRRSIERNRPVLLMNSNHPNRLLFHHWITITGLEERAGEWFVIFSSWGKRYRMNMNQLFPKGWIIRKMGTLEHR